MSDEDSQQDKRVRIDDLVVDRGQHRVFRGDNEIKLPKLSFDLLIALIGAAPNSLSIDELIDCVWSGTVVSPATVAKRVELLRHALGEDTENARYVALVRGHGYRLIPVPRSAARGGEKRGLTKGVFAGVAAIILAVMLAFSFVGSKRPVSNSIAVLPFANLGEKAEGEYLSDGLAMELTSLLTTIPDFKVAAQTSAFAFKGRDVDVGEIARQLRVGHVLTGSVQQHGQRLRISAQLIDADDGFHVWSNNWERELTDIFDIQDEIASAVVRSLRLQLLQDMPSKTETSPEAYALYLQGQQAFVEGREPNVGQIEAERHEEAVSLLTHSLAIDPDFAPAWAYLAGVQFNKAQWAGEDQAEAFALAEATAHRALELNPTEVSALAVLGGVADSWHWDTESAADWYLRALRAAPGNASTLNSVSLLYRRLGNSEVAHRYLLAAHDRDPLNKTLVINLALSFWTEGDFESAEASLVRARELAPNAVRVRVFEGMLAYVRGDYESAAEQFTQHNRTMFACSLFKAGREGEAQIVLDELRSADAVDDTGLASVSACRDDLETAFSWLDQAFKNHDSKLRWIRENVTFEPLHDDPRWDILLQKLGLSDDVANRVYAELGLIGL